MNTFMKNIFLASLVLCNAQPVQVMGISWWTTILGSATATTALAAKHGGWKENKHDIKLGLAGAALAAGVMYGGSRCSVYLKQREVDAAEKAFNEYCLAIGYPNNPKRMRSDLERLNIGPDTDYEKIPMHHEFASSPDVPKIQKKIKALYGTFAETKCCYDKTQGDQARWRSRYIPYTAFLVPALFYATTLSKTKLVPVS